jgi:transcriptional regulator with XRE-family HTH domain
MKYNETFGEFFKKKRIELGLTLRKFCSINGFDPGNISKIERGLLSPPQAYEKRKQYAKALCIKEETDDWLTFCDLASISAGKIPDDFLSDDELIGELPRFFRTARKGENIREKLKELAESIKRESC